MIRLSGKHEARTADVRQAVCNGPAPSSSTTGDVSSLSTLLRLIAYLSRQKLLILGLSVLLVVTVGMQSLQPLVAKIAIDQGVLAGDRGVLVSMAILLIVVGAGGHMLAAGRQYLARWSAQRALFDIREDFNVHLHSKSMSFFDSRQTGELMSRAVNDVNSIQFFFQMSGNMIVPSIFQLILTLGLMFALNWHVTLMITGVVPFVYGLQRWSAPLRTMFRGVQSKMGEMNVEIEESVAGAKVIRAYGREALREERFQRANWGMRTLRIQLVKRIGAYFQGIELTHGLATIVVIGFGSYKVIHGEMTIGDLVAFQGYLLLLALPLGFIGFATAITAQAIASGERIFAVIDVPLEVEEKPDAISIGRPRGEIHYDNVSFGYDGTGPIVRDLNIHVPAGNTLAIIGRSGSGKSTIANLIPRFYDPTEGRITIDDFDLRDLTLESLRSSIGMVMQETVLFNTTARNNISFGRPEATAAEVETAAKAAAAHDFILELPHGYDTNLGERGMRLSGGQRQRIAIARALLVDPPVLIFDEATSSVDARTNVEIQRAIDNLMAGRTTIVIAHRLSTVMGADSIIVLEEGKVVAQGRHLELLENSESYRRIYELQFAGRDEVVPEQAQGDPA